MYVCGYIHVYLYVHFFISIKKVKLPIIPLSGDNRCQSFLMHLSASISMYIYIFFSKMEQTTQ